MDDEEGLLAGSDIFIEPKDYYKPEKDATFASHTLLSGNELTLRLVGHNPLWGHLLWNGGRIVSTHLEERAGTLVEGRTVLELGAGAGLPSIVCAINGADKGYLWGSPHQNLLSHLDNPGEGFDLLILADLLFNHSEHPKLLSTVQSTLKKSQDSRALVFFTPYRSWLLDKDLAFFEIARQGGFTVRKVLEKVMEKVMFEEDPGVSQFIRDSSPSRPWRLKPLFS
ncbi:MAG: nicotinamide n-methyltransferase [Sclerophora amabilis]|nr:MAG: nicotinamide n-methyltransferase [Sclerophora amabilis]